MPKMPKMSKIVYPVKPSPCEMQSIPTSWNISQGKQSRINEVAVSQGEIVKLLI